MVLSLVFPLETLHLSLCKEETPPEQHVGNSSLVKEEPEPPHIKEEQEELLLRPEERLTSLAVKSEDDGEEPVARTLTDHMKTQAEDCGTSQPASNDVLLSSHCSESDTEDSDEWEEKREEF